MRRADGRGGEGLVCGNEQDGKIMRKSCTRPKNIYMDAPKILHAEKVANRQNSSALVHYRLQITSGTLANAVTFRAEYKRRTKRLLVSLLAFPVASDI